MKPNVAISRARGVCLVASLAVALISPNARAQCVGRPTDPGGAGGYNYDTAAQVLSFATPKAKVFYATSGINAPVLTSSRTDGVPDTVALAGQVAEDALNSYAQMGYRPPLDDTGCPSNGGDARTDIYLVKFAGADGMAVSEGCTGHACASYVLCDATFVGHGYADATEAFRTVVTHELFHVIQNAYDASLDRFWAEGTAQWAMKTLHPELMDFERHLPGFFNLSSRSIDAPPGSIVSDYLYGAAIWPAFLATRYDSTLIRAVFEHEADGTESLAAVDAALKAAHSSSLSVEFPLFVAWNACTGSRAGVGGYPNAATYPSISPPPQELAGMVQAVTTAYSNFTYHVTAAAPSQVTIATDATRNGALYLPLEAGACQLDKTSPLPASISGDGLVIVSGIDGVKTNAPFTVSVSGSPSGGGSGCAILAIEPAPTGIQGAAALLFAAIAGLRRWAEHVTSFLRRAARSPWPWGT
jgi:hypothetical protein